MWATPDDASSYEAVRAVLRGERAPLESSSSQILGFMLQDSGGCDAEVVPGSFVLWCAGRGRHRYFLREAPGVLGFLLDGIAFDARHVIRRIGPATVPAIGRAAAWAFDVRYVRIDAAPERTVIRVRTYEALLADLGPEVSIENPRRYLALDHTCPHCGRTPDRFRVLSDGGFVCMACGASSPPRILGDPPIVIATHFDD